MRHTPCFILGPHSLQSWVEVLGFPFVAKFHTWRQKGEGRGGGGGASGTCPKD